MQQPIFTPCVDTAEGKCRFRLLPIRGRSGNSVVRCTNCGLGVTQPHIADISALYEDRQSWDFQPSTAGVAERIKRIAFRHRARSFLRMVAEKPKAIIDYGCGSGLFTSCLKDVSGATVHALDFHGSAPRDLGSAQYRPFSEIGDLAASADLLIASHVLEHDDDPVALIKKMAQLVKPGGRLIIEVPNIDCWGGRAFGSHWEGWYLPYHRLHFSRRSLRAAVQAAGLKVDVECGASVPTMGRTIANIARRDYTLLFLMVGAVLQPLQRAVELITGHASALRIVALKP